MEINKALQYARVGMLSEKENDNQNALLLYKKAVNSLAKANVNKEISDDHKLDISTELFFYAKKIEEITQKMRSGVITDKTENKEPLDKKDKDNKATSFPSASAKNANETKSNDKSEIYFQIKSTIMTQRPKIKLKDVHRLEAEKLALEQAVILPITQPQIFDKMDKYKGFLLYGPPGTGKSYLAKAVAGESTSTFFSVSASDLVSKWQGESERLIKVLFEIARLEAPSIIFMDEIDSLAMSRSSADNDSSRRIKTELLVQLDGITHSNDGVFLMAATNTPESLDEAFLRRFDKLMYVPLPGFDARLRMLGKGFPDMDKSTIAKIAQQTEGFSGSDITVLIKKCKMKSIEQLQRNGYFKMVSVDGKIMYKPCKVGASGSKKMDLSEIPSGSLYFDPKFKQGDILECVSSSRPTTEESKLRTYERFAESRGENFNKYVEQLPRRTFAGHLINAISYFFG